ncbi:uncharacterized protein LOC122510509 [Leptopilina heterotoma]|uniref:uncharacterized protein LOC122510509 n=1 Tax=Leptopilina heterotoma TaxID=63436 RepID=UPI001CA81230|nr:uncharacterized protein LOC122510509 [Leptopilina heterotoma]XP_043481149.1 uncharacterized protein LOC122510509 [Leptopilina heterotoma]
MDFGYVSDDEEEVRNREPQTRMSPIYPSTSQEIKILTTKEVKNVIKPNERKRIYNASENVVKYHYQRNNEEYEIKNIAKSFYWNPRLLEKKIKQKKHDSSIRLDLYERGFQLYQSDNFSIFENVGEFSKNYTKLPPTLVNLCFNCKEYGHLKSNCKNEFFKVLYCFTCGLKGHKTHECNSPKNSNDNNFCNWKEININETVQELTNRKYPEREVNFGEINNFIDDGYAPHCDKFQRNIEYEEEVLKYGGNIYTKQSFEEIKFRKEKELYSNRTEKDFKNVYGYTEKEEFNKNIVHERHRRCFNCKLFGHYRKQCSLKQVRKYCYRCGKDNMTRKNCTNCNKKGESEIPITIHN